MSKQKIKRFNILTYHGAISSKGEHCVLASDYDALEAERNELLGLLREVYSDLPTRRDWLDPVLEARMKATLERHKC